MTTQNTTRRDVMQMAWGMIRGTMQREYRLVQDWTPGPSYGRQRATTAAEKRAVFAAALRKAWATVKMMEASRAARQPATRTAAEIRDQIAVIESADRMGTAGLARVDALHAELARAA